MSENRSSGFPTRSDTHPAAQLLHEERDLKFQIKEVEGLYYPCSENKGADQFRGTAKLIYVFVLAYAKIWFSHVVAHIKVKEKDSIHLVLIV